MTLARVTARVPAKINLSLSVGPLRPDGFHELVTLYQAIALFDDVTVTLKPKDERSTVEVTGEYANSVPLDESNLAYRAATLVLEAYETIPRLRSLFESRFPLLLVLQVVALMRLALC